MRPAEQVICDVGGANMTVDTESGASISLTSVSGHLHQTRPDIGIVHASWLATGLVGFHANGLDWTPAMPTSGLSPPHMQGPNAQLNTTGLSSTRNCYLTLEATNGERPQPTGTPPRVEAASCMGGRHKLCCTRCSQPRAPSNLTPCRPSPPQSIT